MVRSPTPTRTSCACADGTEVQGANLVVATGSYPRSLPGLDFDGSRVLSSDHVLELTELPPRVVIIGGGVIGAEFASMLVDMGSEVTLLEALPRILAPTDADVGNVVARSFKKRGVNVQTSARVTGIEGARELTVTWETDAGEQSVVVDKIIVSVGRAPRSAGFGLEGSPRRASTTAASSSSTSSCAPTCPACSRRATSSTRRSSRTWRSPRRS